VVAGSGVSGYASVSGRNGVPRVRYVRVGNNRFVDELTEAERERWGKYCAAHKDDSNLAVVVDDRLAMGLSLNDSIRSEAKGAVAALKRAGCCVEMLTGDAPLAALHVSTVLGLDAHTASMLPSGKHAWVEAKLAEKKGGVAMFGDGINDSTALAAATVGVAMGAGGTALAARAADIVVLSDNLERLPQAIELATMARNAIGVNIALSAAVKIVALSLALAGMLELWMAVLVDVGSLLFVIANGVRVLYSDAFGEEVEVVLPSGPVAFEAIPDLAEAEEKVE